MSGNSTPRGRKRTARLVMILTARTAGAREPEEKTNVARQSGVHDEGGTSERLIMFPDETARNHFAEAGWSPLADANAEETPVDA